MDANTTLPQAARKLEKYIMTLPAAKRQNLLGSAEREVMMELTQAAAVVRGNIVTLPMTEDTLEQTRLLDESVEGLKSLHALILAASQYDLLDPTDVAHLSALAELIKERLQ